MKRWPSVSFMLVVAMLLLIAGAFWMAYYGDPQWSKWIYLVQTKLYGQEPEVPPGFTGVWRQWYDDGSPASNSSYANGLLDGLSVTWFPTGETMDEGFYAEGEPTGTHLTYYDPETTTATRLFSRREYSVTGSVGTIFLPNGETNSRVIDDRHNRIRVIQKWDKDGVLATTQTTRWDMNNIVISKVTVTNMGASNHTSDRIRQPADGLPKPSR